MNIRGTCPNCGFAALNFRLAQVPVGYGDQGQRIHMNRYSVECQQCGMVFPHGGTMDEAERNFERVQKMVGEGR